MPRESFFRSRLNAKLNATHCVLVAGLTLQVERSLVAICKPNNFSRALPRNFPQRKTTTDLLCVAARHGLVHQQMLAPHLQQVPRPVVHRFGGSVVRTILASLQAGRALDVAHAVPDARSAAGLGPRRGCSSAAGIIGDCGLCEGLERKKKKPG